MKRIMVLLAVGLLAIGCGVNKTYVEEQIAASEARQETKVTDLSGKVTDDIARLQSLAAQLEQKADLAINKASGFENYVILWEGEVNFNFDSFELTATAQDVLNEAGAKMEGSPRALAEIIGHTDATGSAGYNLELGRKRAEAARLYLNDRFGVSLYRLFLTSYGEAKPVALPDERNAASRNRRVIVKIWGPQM